MRLVGERVLMLALWVQGKTIVDAYVFEADFLLFPNQLYFRYLQSFYQVCDTSNILRIKTEIHRHFSGNLLNHSVVHPNFIEFLLKNIRGETNSLLYVSKQKNDI